MNARPVAGAEVFDIHGRAAAYVACVDGGHAVQFIFDDEDGEPHYGEVKTIREVFTSPPSERLHADIATIEATLSQKRTELLEAQAAIRATEQQAAVLRKKIASEPDLKDLALWLEGKVTHIVTCEPYDVRIGTLDEVLLKEQDRQRSIRLLNLRADPTERRYYIAMASYSDGSGSQIACRLATSIEHARELAGERIAIMLKETQDHNHPRIAELAIRLGLPISADLRARVDKHRAEKKDSEVATARKELERAQQKLAVLEGAA